MPFCEYCGRPVRENEICNCRSGNVPPPRPQPMNPYAQPAYAAPQAQPQNRSAGWTSAPVCTPTFKLMLRGHDFAAILAEDLPDGVAVTELLRRGVL